MHTVLDETAKLNVIPSSDSLSIPLSSKFVSRIVTLIVSGSSHSFMDVSFTRDNKFPTCRLPIPVRLTLFYGTTASTGFITKSVILTITFPSGNFQTLEFLLTHLDPLYSAVLGYCWLAKKIPRLTGN